MTSIGHEGPSVDEIEEAALVFEREQPQAPESDPDKGFNYYAWGRLGRKLIEGHMTEAFEQTPLSEPFIYLDGCSSTPWLREVMRGQFGRDLGLKQTKKVINAFETDFKRREANIPWRLRRITREKMIETRARLFPKTSLPRQILDSAVFDLVFDPGKTGVDTSDGEAIAGYFLGRFETYPATYLSVVQENSGYVNEKGSWQSIVDDEAPVSFADIVRSGSLSPEEAEIMIQAIARHFANQLIGQIRASSRFISLDLTRVDVFRRSAFRNFPIDALKTRFFRNVLDPERHLVGDIRDLSVFGDRSVSIYSMIEGFPFYADYFTDEDGIRLLGEARRVLKDGGKLILFPWIARDGRDLSVFEEVLGDLGFEVRTEDKGRDELLDGMNNREMALVARSPVFTDTQGPLPLLVATKMAD
ncbi:MAG: class I SAM-dependent methyltransferase [Candidatus Levybacteria bacterium]|nr:class I SAM-dependent methyltransferase [Candidatus Levybacteria bacterium]